jgi:D-serine deaminase-like pyridoxal phosphate-dependent protein
VRRAGRAARLPAGRPERRAPEGARRSLPGTRFSALVDDETALARIAEAFDRRPTCRRAIRGAKPLELLLDLDVGMHRSGIEPGRAPHGSTPTSRTPGA